MARLFPILFALVIGFQPLGEAFFYGWYLVANDSFTAAFCVNQDKPEMMCSGKCHLEAISSVETEKDAQTAPPPAMQKPHSPDSCLPPEAMPKCLISDLTTIERYTYCPDRKGVLHAKSLFHPPEEA